MNGLALFAGVGGLELGIKQLFPKSRIVCYVEGEAYASAVLVSKMEKGLIHEAPIWSDVRTFNGSIFSGKVDFITAGFPCQPWSVAGKLQKTDDERWLWDDIERIICEVRPSFIFLENVPGLINGGIDPVLGSLASIGFNAEWGCLKVSEVGGNHHRKRIFIFGYLPNSNSFTDYNGRDHQIIQKSILEWDINIRRSNGYEWKLQPIKEKGSFGNIPNSNSPRSRKSRILFKGANGSKFECDGETRAHIQYPGSEGWGKFDLSSITIEMGFITRGHYEDGRSPAWWSVEPGICRVVDGVANRVDRLRACGNGVVPYQAYRAFAELISRAIERGELIDS